MIRYQVKNIQLSIRKISEKAKQQEACIRFDIGQPSFDTPNHVKEAAKKGLEEKQGYTSTLGMKDLRKEIAREESSKKGVSMNKENIMVTTGGMEALYAVFASSLTHDDKIVLNDPCWGPYKLMSEVNGNRWSQVKYFEDEELTDQVRKEFRDAKIAVVNTPSNPSGRVLEKNQAREIAELAEETDTFLVSDEVYHRITFDREHVSPAQFTENSLIIGSTSKNHAMTGFRIGWMTADKELIGEFAKTSRAMTACPPRVSQYAAIEALRNDSHVGDMRADYEKRRDIVVERMNDLEWNFVQPEGAIYTFPEVGRSSWDFCMEMIENGVSMIPGEPFGPGSDQKVRICFGSTSVKEIGKAFDILEDNLW